MIKNLIRAIPVIGVLIAAPASAAVYNITGVLDPIGSPNGFGSSMFHDQVNSQMNGATVEDPTSASGTWNTNNGKLNFSMNLASGGSVSISGKLLVSARAPSSAGYNGVYTDSPLQFAFTGGSYGGQTMDFSFADTFHNPEANGFNAAMISLWGDNGAFAKLGTSGCKSNPGTCLGADLRLEISPNGGPGVVPLPASALFLLAGIGGLGGLRRFKKKAA